MKSDLKVFCGKIMQFCFDVTGKGNVNENSIGFYARELYALSEVQIKAAFSHYASEGVFPTVAQIKSHSGAKTDFKEQAGTGDGSKKWEDKVKEQTSSRTLHSAFPFEMPWALELWCPRGTANPEEALKHIEGQLELLEQKGIFRDPIRSAKIEVWLVNQQDDLASGSKVTSVSVPVYKTIVFCRTCHNERDKEICLLARQAIASAQETKPKL